MKLTSPSGRRSRPVSSNKRATTTEPGYRNPNGQIVMAATGAPSTSRDGQRIYRLRCEHCGHVYGANGMEIHQRLCPSHQGGEKGEPLRESLAPTLFS